MISPLKVHSAHVEVNRIQYLVPQTKIVKEHKLLSGGRLSILRSRIEVIRNREVEPLALPSNPDYALTMSDITTLLQTAKPYDLDSMPSGIIDLLWLTNSTSMTYIDNLSRTEILILGNKRHCSSRRAEAVMSALGITEWYDLYRDAPLVLNQYPLEFFYEPDNAWDQPASSASLSPAQILAMLYTIFARRALTSRS